MAGKKKRAGRGVSHDAKAGRWFISLVCWTLLSLAGTRSGVAIVHAEERAEPSSRVDLYGDPLPAMATVRLGSTRLRPGGWIDSLVFSSDGKRLYSTGYHGVFAWEAATGKLLRRYRTGEEDVSHLTL